MMNKVTTVISVYNGAKYLEAAIESILNQTHKNIEIVIIDDCSKDNSREIISKYKDDERFIIRFNEFNLGLNKNIQIGVELATGDYICFLDQDDMFVETKFEEQINYIQNNHLDGVYAATQEVDENGNILPNQPNLDNFEKLYNSGNAFKTICTVPSDVYLPMSQSALFKAKTIKELNPIRSRLFLNDWPILIKSFEKYNIGFMNKIMFQLRKHSESATNDQSWNKSITLQAIIMAVPSEYQQECIANMYNLRASLCYNAKKYSQALRCMLLSLIWDFDKSKIKFTLKCARKTIKAKLKG